jgi:predicted ATPase
MPQNVDDSRIPTKISFQNGQIRSAYYIAKDSLGKCYEFEQGTQETPFWAFSLAGGGVYRRFDPRRKELVRINLDLSDRNLNESLLSHIGNLEHAPVVRGTLSSWSVYHDIHVERGSKMRGPATTQFTKRLATDGSNLVTVLHTLYTGNREFRSQIDEGMRAGFGGEYERLEFQPAAAQQIQLAVQWKSSSQPHAGSDLSDGTLRFLFLLTVLSHPEPAALVAIDEPETGLHPSMLPVIAEYAAAASERTQVVLASHSPEFLDAFSEASPHVTVCHWDQGQTLFYALPPERLSRWLKQYRLGHLFTRGDLESLAREPEPVEPVGDSDERFQDLPPEDEAMSTLPADPEADADS